MTAINKQIKSILASYTALKLKSYDNNVQALSLVAAINEGIIKSKDDINLLIFETQFKDKNGALIRFFKQLLDQISVDSYQNYSVNFSSFNHKDTLDINADSISISDFKRDVLDSVPTTLSAQEKEPVIQELISEKS